MNSTSSYIIGIDIGGTNTDGVLIDHQHRILASCKQPTEHPLENGVKKSILKLLELSNVGKSDLCKLLIGTTHATNAILEAKNLFKVGVIRLAGQRPNTLPPCFKWPQHIYQAVFTGLETVSGGYHCDQREITPLSKKEVQAAALNLVGQGMESLAIVGVFSPICPKQELVSLEWIREILGPAFPVTLSSEIGGTGFIERENAAILNAALKKPMRIAFENIQKMKLEIGINAPALMTQNDGSLIDLQQAIEKPLLTISSGPTNSFIGGAILADLKEAIIVDIGGTSTDIGVVLNGYPRRSVGLASIGGIGLNFRMPDVLSLPIGGGSVVRRTDTGFSVGPDSIGSLLFTEGYLFGGNTLTMTDAAFKSSHIDIAKASKTFIPLEEEEAKEILDQALRKIQDSVRMMKGSKKHLPVVAVGGGAFFLKGIADVIPHHSGVANALGAALAEISYTVDRVVSLEEREKALATVSEEALMQASLRGADKSSLRIIDLQVLPYHYVPNKIGRVIATAAGKQNSTK